MSLLTSLKSYWKLDEASGNATDAHGSNTLTDNNLVGTNTGKISTARTFVAASTQYLTHASNSDLSPGDIDFTFAGWFWIDDFTVSSSFPMILAKSGSAIEYEMFCFGGTSIAWRITAATEGLLTINQTFSTTGVWVFFEAYHDSVNNLIGFRLNNNTAVTTTATGGPVGTAEAFALGARGNGVLPLSGRVDEVGFWHRLLTSDERASLYNSGAGFAYPFSSASTLFRRSLTNRTGSRSAAA